MAAEVKIKCGVKQTTPKAWLIEAKHVNGNIIEAWIPVSQILKAETKPRMASDPYH